MKRRTVRLAVGIWCLAIVYGVTTLQDQWSASEASQAGPVIRAMEEVSPPGESLEETVTFVKDFLLQGSPYTTLRQFLFGASVDSHDDRPKPAR
jgi:hypothetical protein